MGIEKLIGNTPLVRLDKLHDNPDVQIYAKLEGNNPGGSVKDRAAYYMIKDALDKNIIKAGDTLVEATSGNTGIALAMIAACYGVKIKLIMPESATPERVGTMKAFGAEVILTPKEKTIEYSRVLAQELADENGYVILDQFNNANNRQAHIETTGPEIWRDTDQKITHFVSSMGTTGTITGCSTYLKSQNPNVQIIGVQPEEGHRIPGIRKWSPETVPSIYQPERIDQLELVDTDLAIAHARALASQEGIFAGMSTGGACAVALRIAKQIPKGVIVFIACDRGDRYLSSPLFS